MADHATRQSEGIIVICEDRRPGLQPDFRADNDS